MKIECNLCKKQIIRQPSWVHEKNFCNKQCYVKFQSTLKGKETNNWRGGGYKFNCKHCQKPCERKRSPIVPKYCSTQCAGKDRGLFIRGDKHWAWRGGNNSRYIKTIAPRPRPEKCEVCGEAGKKRNGIVLDHNHKTAKFRGWLCSNCNTIIGLAHEDHTKLYSLIKYLKNNENQL